MEEEKSPPVPTKLYPQLSVECPEEYSELRNYPSKPPESLTLQDSESSLIVKPVPVPRTSLQRNNALDFSSQFRHKPVPKPRNICPKFRESAQNPMYFTVSVDEENGEVQSVVSFNPSSVENNSEIGKPQEDLVLEFDPFAPMRDGFSKIKTRHGLTNSVFCLDRISSVSSQEKEHGFTSIAETDTRCDEENVTRSPKSPFLENRISSKIDLKVEEALIESSDAEIMSSVKSSLNCLNPDDELSSTSSNDNDPPPFPPPPLPDGFSASTLSLEFIGDRNSLAENAVEDNICPVPPIRSDSAEAPPPETTPPPKLPAKLSRTSSLVAVKDNPFDESITKASSTNSSPILRPRETIEHSHLPPVTMAGAVPPAKPPRLAPRPPPPFRGQHANIVEEDNTPAPPLPPKKIKGHNRSSSWNFADFVRHSHALLKGTRTSKNIPADENNSSPPSLSRQFLAARALKGIPYSGHLLKTGSNRKDFRQRWCVLENAQLKYYVDDKADAPQGIIDQSEILSIGVVTDMKNGSTELHCFELNTVKEKGRSYLFGALLPSDLEGWMEHIVLTIAPQRCREDNKGFKKAGYTFVRVGMTGVWSKEWCLLRGKTLSVTLDDRVEKLDLRKLMSIQMHPADKHQSCRIVLEEGSPFHLDFPGKTLYMQSDLRKETDHWYMLLRKTMLNVGDAIDDQQLTQDNVPVIVDKCITFVSVHGCTAEGVYRLNGVKSKVTKLLSVFKQDAWAFTVKQDDYSVNDVASAMKRFLRTLPDSLLTKDLYDEWFQCTALENRQEKLSTYEKILPKLPEVNYCTLKRIIGHLRSISDHSDRNKMTTSNLAAIFGPTLLTTETDDSIPNLLNTNAEMDIVSDLILDYPLLFKVSEEEIKKDLVIQKALMDIKEAKRAKRPAGDILIGVYVYSKEFGKCLNVRISPTMTAFDLCVHAMHNARIKDRLECITVFEVVCNGELERPLHFTEVVLSVTLRWARWADTEAKNNYLVIKKNELYNYVMPLARQPISLFGEFKYAGRKSKNFKKFLIEFKNARLAFYKDAKLTSPEGTWNIEDITWYLGHESIRRPPSEWAITFIEKNAEVKRTKEYPYFGRTVCCAKEEEFLKMVAAMLTGEYPNGLFPRRDTPDLLD